MKRTNLNFLVDALAAIALLGLTGTGILLTWVLPPGTGHSLLLWGLGRHDWGDVHFWLAVAFIGGIVLHVLLHWAWVVITCASLGRGHPCAVGSGKRALAGLLTVLACAAMLGGFWYLAVASVQPTGDTSEHGRGEARRREGGAGLGKRSAGTTAPAADAAPDPADDEHAIRGSMTLEEAARAVGISVEQARARLGLGADVAPTERLGPLARRMGTDMQALRKKLMEAQ